MVKHQRTELLVHPVVMALTQETWKRGGFYYFYVSIFGYLLYLGLLNAFALLIPPPYVTDEERTANCSEFGIDLVGIIDYYLPRDEDGNLLKSAKYDTLYVPGMPEEMNYCHSLRNIRSALDWILIIYSIFKLVVMFLRISYQRLDFLKKASNLCEMLMFVLTFLFAINLNPEITSEPLKWQWVCGICAIWLSWIMLLVKMQKVPGIGYFVIMFNQIMKTFTSFSILFFMGIVATAILMVIMFQDRQSFSTFFASYLSTCLIFVEKFSWINLFGTPCSSIGPEATEETDDCKSFDDLGQNFMIILFTSFIIVMPLVLVNLIAALAIEDIKLISANAIFKKMSTQVKQTLESVYQMPNKYRAELIHIEYLNSVMKTTEDTLSKDAFNMETSSGKLTKRAIKELHKECLEETLSVDALMQNVNRRITAISTHIEDNDAKFNKLELMIDQLVPQAKS